MFAAFDRDCARPPKPLDTSKVEWVDPGARWNPGEGYERASHHLHAMRRLRYGENHPEARNVGPLTDPNCDFQEFYCGVVLADRTTGAFRGGGAVAYSKSAPVTMAWAVQQCEPARQLPAVVVCSGSVTNLAEVRSLYGLPDAPDQSSAQLLLDLYCKDFGDAYGDVSDQPASCLSTIEGDWSFVLFDAGMQYLLIGQSTAVTPQHTLHWGTAKEDSALLLSTEPDVLRHMCSSRNGGLTTFPSGCYFENDGFLNHVSYESGNIFSFNRPKNRRPVHAIPRVDSRNHICGMSFRTESNTDMCSTQTPPRH